MRPESRRRSTKHDLGLYADVFVNFKRNANTQVKKELQQHGAFDSARSDKEPGHKERSR